MNNVVVVFGIIGLALFVLAWLMNRRFGLLGLALAAGSLLSGIWAPFITSVIAESHYVQMGELTNAIILSAIVLAPAVLLLLHGSRYKSAFPRLVGAVMFGILALAFLVQPLGYVFPAGHGQAGAAYSWLVDNEKWVIGVGLILAVLDMFFTKPAAHHVDKKEKH